MANTNKGKKIYLVLGDRQPPHNTREVLMFLMDFLLCIAQWFISLLWRSNHRAHWVATPRSALIQREHIKLLSLFLQFSSPCIARTQGWRLVVGFFLCMCVITLIMKWNPLCAFVQNDWKNESGQLNWKDFCVRHPFDRGRAKPSKGESRERKSGREKLSNLLPHFYWEVIKAISWRIHSIA